MIQVLRQAFRGCRELPHVGKHTGTWSTPVLLFFNTMIMVLSFGTWVILIPTFTIILIVIGHLWLGYLRAELSDATERWTAMWKEGSNENDQSI